MNERIANRTLPLLAALALLLVPFAGARAAETGAVGELFLCTFHEGKGWDDFEVAAAHFNEVTKKIGNGWEDVNAYVWRPFRANVDFDFVWDSYTPNANQWGRTMDAYMASAAGRTADALWDTVAKCSSALTFVRQIYDDPDFPPANFDNRAIVESYSCRRRTGTTSAALQEAIDDWHAHATAIEFSGDVYMRTPFVVNSEYDHGYFVVHEDFSSYAANATSYLTNPASAGVDERISGVQDCEVALWTSWRVSPPIEE